MSNNFNNSYLDTQSINYNPRLSEFKRRHEECKLRQDPYFTDSNQKSKDENNRLYQIYLENSDTKKSHNNLIPYNANDQSCAFNQGPPSTTQNYQSNTDGTTVIIDGGGLPNVGLPPQIFPATSTTYPPPPPQSATPSITTEYLGNKRVAIKPSPYTIGGGGGIGKFFVPNATAERYGGGGGLSSAVITGGGMAPQGQNYHHRSMYNNNNNGSYNGGHNYEPAAAEAASFKSYNINKETSSAAISSYAPSIQNAALAYYHHHDLPPTPKAQVVAAAAGSYHVKVPSLTCSNPSNYGRFQDSGNNNNNNNVVTAMTITYCNSFSNRNYYQDSSLSSNRLSSASSSLSSAIVCATPPPSYNYDTVASSTTSRYSSHLIPPYNNNNNVNNDGSLTSSNNNNEYYCRHTCNNTNFHHHPMTNNAPYTTTKGYNNQPTYNNNNNNPSKPGGNASYPSALTDYYYQHQQQQQQHHHHPINAPPHQHTNNNQHNRIPPHFLQASGGISNRNHQYPLPPHFKIINENCNSSNATKYPNDLYPNPSPIPSTNHLNHRPIIEPFIDTATYPQQGISLGGGNGGVSSLSSVQHQQQQQFPPQKSAGMAAEKLVIPPFYAPPNATKEERAAARKTYRQIVKAQKIAAGFPLKERKRKYNSTSSTTSTGSNIIKNGCPAATTPPLFVSNPSSSMSSKPPDTPAVSNTFLGIVDNGTSFNDPRIAAAMLPHNIGAGIISSKKRKHENSSSASVNFGDVPATSSAAAMLSSDGETIMPATKALPVPATDILRCESQHYHRPPRKAGPLEGGIHSFAPSTTAMAVTSYSVVNNIQAFLDTYQITDDVINGDAFQDILFGGGGGVNTTAGSIPNWTTLCVDGCNPVNSNKNATSGPSYETSGPQQQQQYSPYQRGHPTYMPSISRPPPSSKPIYPTIQQQHPRLQNPSQAKYHNSLSINYDGCSFNNNNNSYNKPQQPPPIALNGNCRLSSSTSGYQYDESFLPRPPIYSSQSICPRLHYSSSNVSNDCGMVSQMSSSSSFNMMTSVKHLPSGDEENHLVKMDRLVNENRGGVGGLGGYRGKSQSPTQNCKNKTAPSTKVSTSVTGNSGTHKKQTGKKRQSSSSKGTLSSSNNSSGQSFTNSYGNTNMIVRNAANFSPNAKFKTVLTDNSGMGSNLDPKSQQECIDTKYMVPYAGTHNYHYNITESQYHNYGKESYAAMSQHHYSSDAAIYEADPYKFPSNNEPLTVKSVVVGHSRYSQQISNTFPTFSSSSSCPPKNYHNNSLQISYTDQVKVERATVNSSPYHQTIPVAGNSFPLGSSFTQNPGGNVGQKQPHRDYASPQSNSSGKGNERFPEHLNITSTSNSPDSKSCSTLYHHVPKTEDLAKTGKSVNSLAIEDPMLVDDIDLLFGVNEYHVYPQKLNGSANASIDNIRVRNNAGGGTPAISSSLLIGNSNNNHNLEFLKSGLTGGNGSSTTSGVASCSSSLSSYNGCGNNSATTTPTDEHLLFQQQLSSERDVLTEFAATADFFTA